MNVKVHPIRDTNSILANIDQELDQLTSSAEKFVQGLYVEADDAAHYRSGITNAADRRRLESRSAPTALVRHFDSQDEENDDEVEEIKLSHEIVADSKHEEKLTEQLKSQFQVMQQQLDQYKQLFKSSFEKLKDAETKVIDLQGKVEDLEEERTQLAHQLEAGVVSDGQGSTNNVVNRMPAQRRVFPASQELNKRSEDIRKALLFDNDDEDIGLSMEGLLSQHNNLKALMHKLQSLLTPFRRDIRTIQARFGSSTASYFIFYRYM
jgi:hypothetical protein